MLKAILIDDEDNSLSALKEKIIHHCPQIEIIDTTNIPAEGIEKINSLKPDIVFLDIEMPGINGFNLLQHLTYKNFEIVFVTAYDHYAIRAIRLSALDYLVKPVDVEELKATIEKAIAKKTVPASNQQLEFLLEQLSDKKNLRRIAIPTQDGLRFIKINEIIYLEASLNYTYIHTTNEQKYIISRTLKDFEEILPSEIFIRIHNSYIINKDFLEKYIRGDGGQVVMTNGVALDVAKRKKTDFLKAMGY